MNEMLENTIKMSKNLNKKRKTSEPSSVKEPIQPPSLPPKALWTEPPRFPMNLSIPYSYGMNPNPNSVCSGMNSFGLNQCPSFNSEISFPRLPSDSFNPEIIPLNLGSGNSSMECTFNFPERTISRFLDNN